MHAASWDSAQTRSQGLRGLKKTVTKESQRESKVILDGTKVCSRPGV
jgi:hypothetical protein